MKVYIRESIATCLLAALLWLVPYTAGAATVIEFYNTNLDNYFITADTSEAAVIDGGGAGPGWSRTGDTFNSAGATPVCRFYGSQSPGPNSHFYTVDPVECQGLKDQQIPAGDPRKLTVKSWNFESLDFLSTPPSGGSCPAGMAPVYRAYNNGASRGVDSNHRISGNLAAIQQEVARGWKNEGVVMCAESTYIASPLTSGDYWKFEDTGLVILNDNANTTRTIEGIESFDLNGDGVMDSILTGPEFEIGFINPPGGPPLSFFKRQSAHILLGGAVTASGASLFPSGEADLRGERLDAQL